MKKTSKMRVTLDLENDLYELLTKTAKRHGIAKAQAMRRALTLADYVDSQIDAGWKLKLEKGDKRVEIFFV